MVNPNNQYYVYKNSIKHYRKSPYILHLLTVRTLTKEEKQEINEYWESIFIEVVDVNNKEIFVRLYENEDMLYLISFDGTKKLNSISDW